MPVGLRAYILICALCALAIALVPLVLWRSSFGDVPWLPAGILMASAALAVRFPMQWRRDFEIFFLTVPLTALILILPWQTTATLVGIAVVVAYGVLLRRDQVETIFNASQAILHTAIAAYVLRLTSDWPFVGPELSQIAPWGSIAITLVAIYVANYGLVAAATALQQRSRSFLTYWWQYLTRDVATEATMMGVGVIAAILALQEPLMLPVLAVPVALISISSRRAKQLENDTEAALTRLVELLELRDAYTAGHSRRVSELSHGIALQLGMTMQDSQTVQSAGEVHDIGKIIIDPAVLQKTGRLTDAEFDVIKQHPVHGASIISRFATYGDGYLMVRHHHERYDGGGYPDGLAGEDIPIGARIIAVADSFDAMSSARAYRDAMPRERVLSILVEGAGTQWDANIVAALLNHLGVTESDGIRWPSLAPIAPAPAPTPASVHGA